MENNVKNVQGSKSLHKGAIALINRINKMLNLMIGENALEQKFNKGGR